MSNVTNIKIIEGVNDQASEIAFWISEGLCLMIGLVSIFGNGLVWSAKFQSIGNFVFWEDQKKEHA